MKTMYSKESNYLNSQPFFRSDPPHGKRFNSVTVDIGKVRVEDTADFALKLFSTVNKMRQDRKAGECTHIQRKEDFYPTFVRKHDL